MWFWICGFVMVEYMGFWFDVWCGLCWCFKFVIVVVLILLIFVVVVFLLLFIVVDFIYVDFS